MTTSLTTTPTAPQPEAAGILTPFCAEGHHALVGAWLAWLREQVDQRQVAAGTVATYGRCVRVWLAYLDTIARTDQPTPAMVGRFFAAILPGRKPAAANLLLNVVKSFYRWCEANDHCPNVARSVRSARVHRDGPLPALDHQQVAALLQLIAGDDLRALRDRALVATLYGTACRTVSLARARVDDLDVAAGTLRHRPKGHSSVDAIAYLPPGALATVTAYLAARHRRAEVASEQPLFVAVGGNCWGMPLTTCSMRAVVRALMERAGHARRGLDGRLLAPGVWSAHSLRRSSLTTTADAFGLEAARSLAGHASVEQTQRTYVTTKLDGQMRRVAAVLNLETCNERK